MSKYKYYGLTPSISQKEKWIDEADSSYESYLQHFLVWDCDSEVWTTKARAEVSGVRTLTFAPVFSVHSAKRHLKKHTEIPDGVEFVLEARFTDTPSRYFIKGEQETMACILV